MNRREVICTLAALATGTVPSTFSNSQTHGSELGIPEYHGYAMQDLRVDRCKTHMVKPKKPLAGSPWIWRATFWDQFPSVDLALLEVGFHLAFIDVGNTFGCPDAMKHFDVFYATMTLEHGLAAKPALEGLSRGGLYIYRWAYGNTAKVGCLYGDAPVC